MPPEYNSGPINSYIMNVLDEGRGNILSSKPVLTEGKLLHVFCAELCLLFYIFHIM